MTTMMYRAPGEHQIHGGWFDYIIVSDDTESIDQSLANGWSLTTTEAHARYEIERRQLDAIAEEVAAGAMPDDPIAPAPVPLERRKPGRPRKDAS